LWSLSARGGVLLGASNEDSYSESSISSSMVMEINQGLEVMTLHPMWYPTMQLLIFFQRFRYVLDWFQNVGSCDMSNALGLVVGFSIRIAIWFRHSRKAIEEEDDGTI
jgi:hypothetical protein